MVWKGLNIKGTETLDNAYKKFGDIAYVDHWYKKMPGEIYNKNPLRRSEEKKPKVLPIFKRPLWYRRAVKTINRKDRYLNIFEKQEHFLVTRNEAFGKYSYLRTTHEVELRARKNKDNDWRIEIMDFSENLIYQRQGKNKWLLIEIAKGIG